MQKIDRSALAKSAVAGGCCKCCCQSSSSKPAAPVSNGRGV